MKFRTGVKIRDFLDCGQPAPTLGGGDRSGERDYDNFRRGMTGPEMFAELAARFAAGERACFLCFTAYAPGGGHNAPPPKLPVLTPKPDRYVVSTGSRACAGCSCLLPP
jgi:hypothetical protein